MSLQSQFKKFNDNIRLDYSTDKELAKKRDILLGILEKNNNLPSFSKLNQGSYAIFTGVYPDETREYDIDVGLRFNVNKSDYSPMDLKEEIENSLDGHTYYGAEIKKPCVTVTYIKDGEPSFHVDLVTYVYDNKDDKESQMFIAKGKSTETQKWEKADPVGLVNYINNKVDDEDARNQFRRIVRYLKHWKHKRFVATGHSEPPSIGITLLVLKYFSGVKDDDLHALYNATVHIRNEFKFEGISENGRDLYRIKLSLPFELNFEYNSDIFEKMSDIQMTDFRDKIIKLENDLKDVNDEVDEYEKCKKLQKIFGEEFEVPEESKLAKPQYNFLPGSSSAGME